MSKPKKPIPKKANPQRPRLSVAKTHHRSYGGRRLWDKRIYPEPCCDGLWLFEIEVMGM